MFKKLDLENYKVILFAALIARLIAVVFSQGYGMHDDHFLIIESSSSWANGADYNDWLPWSKGNDGHPEGHSFSYVGLNYCYFAIMKLVGFSDPKMLMLFNRLIHALASLVVVWYGMKIAEKISTRKNAVRIGWILALLWVMPNLSVRNLVEIAAVPFLVFGTWMLIKGSKSSYLLIGGLFIGMAVSFRYQIGVFAIGLAIVYLFKKELKSFFLFSLGTCITFILTQGLVDGLIWGYPFAELMAYVTYNMKEGTQYLPNSNYGMYFYVLAGCLLFPLGILMLIGFFKAARKFPLIFIPTILFILFHTFYPNRQERFVLSILPFFIILGVIGISLFKEGSFFKRIEKFSYRAFWVLNILLLFIVSTMYSKQSRVESMYFLTTTDATNELILAEGSATGDLSMLPKFYANNWKCGVYELTDLNQLKDFEDNPAFDFIYFFDEKSLQKRINIYKKLFPKMHLVKKCYPSFMDALLHKINPRNTNEYIEIWATEFQQNNSLK
jgi:hypothetical protein